MWAQGELDAHLPSHSYEPQLCPVIIMLILACLTGKLGPAGLGSFVFVYLHAFLNIASLSSS